MGWGELRGGRRGEGGVGCVKATMLAVIIVTMILVVAIDLSVHLSIVSFRLPLTPSNKIQPPIVLGPSTTPIPKQEMTHNRF